MCYTATDPPSSPELEGTPLPIPLESLAVPPQKARLRASLGDAAPSVIQVGCGEAKYVIVGRSGASISTSTIRGSDPIRCVW
jgi:hypothetical protein